MALSDKVKNLFCILGYSMTINNKILIIGIGNEYRGDDAAGLIVARELKRKSLPNVEITEASGEGSRLMEMWGGRDTVILIDACTGSDNAPYVRIEANQGFPAAGSLRCSSHAFGVYEAIEMSRVLDSLPKRLIVYAISGYRFEQGAGLSPEVAESIKEVVMDIEKFINNIGEIIKKTV